MSYVFCLDENQKTVLRPDAIKLKPELIALNDKEVVCLILAYDYYSPFHQSPEENDRRRKASSQIYGNDEPKDLWTSQRMKIAIECYRSLQYDMRQELKQTYYADVQKTSKMIGETNDPKEKENLVKSITGMMKFITELDKQIVADIREAGVVVGGSKISFLQKMQQNDKVYNSLFKK